MEIEIKNMNADNAPELAKAAKEIWNEHFLPIIGQAQVDYMLEKFQSEQAIRQQINEGIRYIGAYVDSRLVGYSCYKLESERLFISKLYVKKENRGLGIGRAMFNHELNLARESGKSTLYLTVNKYNELAISVYKRLGFYVEDSDVTDIGGGFVMDDYIMAYDL